MVDTGAWQPNEGDDVLVPWGFDRLHGRILRIYGPPGRPTALVAVALEGVDGDVIGEETVSFPLAHLQPAEKKRTA